jgi:hypothetical protein
MGLLHICNTNFEEELASKTVLPLPVSFKQHSVFTTLQFLPCLYAAEEDGYVTTEELPSHLKETLQKKKIILPRHYLFDSIDFSPYRQIESWGFSLSVKKWADEKGLFYPHPPWDLVAKVNSKLFSFSHAAKLPGAALLSNEKQTDIWLKHTRTPFVLKSCFGVSGGGHLIQHTIDRRQIDAFLQREWKEERPVIAEPWVERVLDFSTQWIIAKHKKIDYQGATLCESDRHGTYRQNKVGDEKMLFGDYLSYLDQHRESALILLHKMAECGFFGNVGIDAFVYRDRENFLLHPIVEINARKTMGWIALELQKRYFPQEMLALSFSPKRGFTFNSIRV